MIKSNGGSGYVRNVLFENFIAHSTAYTLDIDQYWSGQAAGDQSTGVQLNNITFSNWKGTCANGDQRAPIQVLCSDAAPCTDVTIEDIAIWTDSGSSELYKCRSAHGTGGCLKSGSGSYAQVSQTVSSAPYVSPSSVRVYAKFIYYQVGLQCSKDVRRLSIWIWAFFPYTNSQPSH
jgi:rhamnogalacturonan hydrolase